MYASLLYHSEDRKDESKMLDEPPIAKLDTST
jgi:hypothetical protein